MDYSIENQRLLIEGQPLSFFSGSYQYWRIQPDLWVPILDKVKGMGFGIIETYMPWSVHETAPGVFDFGVTDPHRDVRRFLDVCHAAGVKVLARPGPHINAEMTYFGYPEWLFADEDLLARCADGSPVVLPAPPRMFPLPCYYHPRFGDGVRRYFEALAEAIGGRSALYPDGPIIAIQADNECSKFMRANPFDWDYSEHAIVLYRRWLEQRYSRLDDLNEAYGSRYGAWALVDPPRALDASGAGLRRMLDWAEFGEHYINESVRGIATMLRDLFGDEVPMFHNYPVTLPVPPLDLSGAESFLDFQGIDAYPQKGAYQTIRAGVKYTSAMSRLPIMAEFSSGSVYYALPLTLDDQEFTSRAILMHGIKGVNFYMIVERERWYGSPVKSDGTLRERHYAFFRKLLGEVREWGLEDMSCERPTLLLLERDYERLAGLDTMLCPNSRLAAQFLTGFDQPADLLVSAEEHGLSEAVASRYLRLLSFWYWALSASGAHFAMGDTSASAEMLKGYSMVVVPTFEFMDRAVQQRLLDFARAGGTLVVGPRAPELDERMEPCEVLRKHMHDPVETRADATVFGVRVEEVSMFADEASGEAMTYRHAVGDGQLVHVGLLPEHICSTADAEPFAPMMDTLMRMAGIEPSFVAGDPRIDIAVWRSGGSALVFVANPTDEEIATTISHTAGLSLTDLETSLALEDGEAPRITLEPWTIKVLGGGR